VDEEVLSAFAVVLTDAMSAVEKENVEIQAKRNTLQKGKNGTDTSSSGSRSNDRLSLRSGMRIQAKGPPAPVRFMVRTWSSTRVLADQVRATVLRIQVDSAIIVE
jgi:hypothetical protein